jgi:hypothetical protein
MSDYNLLSLLDLIAKNLRVREFDIGTPDHLSPYERALRRTEFVQFDQEFRKQLDTIDEVPDLLRLQPQLQEGWPYPAIDSLERFRAEVAAKARKSLPEINELPLREVLKILSNGSIPQNGSPANLLLRKEITPSMVSALPRWARLAFATRCIRRLSHLLTEVARQTSSMELEGIEKAIQLAEDSARQGSTISGAKDLGEKVIQQAHQAMRLAGEPVREGIIRLGNRFRGTVGWAAGLVACAVDGDTSLVIEAYEKAVQAAYILPSHILLEGMKRDFEYLEARSKKENWTDSTPVSSDTIPQPRLKLVSLHIRNLGPIRQFDLPQDGLGWQGQTPDLMLLGGINGSGKTTLLKFITECFSHIRMDLFNHPIPVSQLLLSATEALLDFEIESYEIAKLTVRFLIGNQEFLDKYKTENCWWIRHGDDPESYCDAEGHWIFEIARTIQHEFSKSTLPSVVFLPSEHRTLNVPGEYYKAAGKLEQRQEFIHRWQPPGNWKDSLEALLYSLRWEDLNAKEEGRFTETNHFSAYADAFRRFTGEGKFLKFEEGKLVVKIAGSNVSHELSELSSGEKQVLLLTGELLRYWRPGSLILIDEPELHLHTRWQTQLFVALQYWQKERGGQIIMATQSAHFVELSGSGSAALLGMEPL